MAGEMKNTKVSADPETRVNPMLHLKKVLGGNATDGNNSVATAQFISGENVVPSPHVNVNSEEPEIQLMQDENGCKFTYNRITGESLWLDSGEVGSEDEKGEEKEENGELNELEIHEDENGDKYTYNRITGEAEWVEEE